jgi:heptaprenyl diphosphate synthase
MVLMPLPNELRRQEAAHKTVWILLAVAMSAAEFLFPRIPLFPWLKPGIANCVTLAWIIEFGAADALLFFLVRTWIVGFYFGFSFLTIALSLSGGVLATIVMGILWNVAGKRRMLGTVGICIIGALFHNFGQIVTVYFLMVNNAHLFYQVPLMLGASIVFGGITGVLTVPLLSFLRNIPVIGPSEQLSAGQKSSPISFKNKAASFSIIIGSFALVFIGNLLVLAFFALLSTIFVQVLFKGSLGAIIKPIQRFWLLFFFIGCIQLFYAYGVKIEALPFLTRESVVSTAQQWLRLWTWLQLSFILTHFKFHRVLFSILSTLFSRHESTLEGGLLALELFPATISVVQTRLRKRILRLLVHPIKNGKKGIGQVYEEIVRLMR